MGTARPAREGVLLAILLAGCGGCGGPERPEPTPAAPAASASADPTRPSASATTANPGVPQIRLEDDGSVVTLPLGGTAVLFLPTREWAWSDPEVTGSSVNISEDVSDEGAASRSWTITARDHGAGTVRMTGTPTCRSAAEPCSTPLREFAIDVVVP